MYHEPTEQEKAQNPDWLYEQAESLLEGYDDAVANASNLSALLYHSLGQVNWVGFYFLRDGRLIVGPFQGKPACVEIPVGRGVCGAAAASREIQRVDDVHAHSDHIFCDLDTRSEIVLPLVRDGELIGVLDLDSPVPARFGDRDQDLLEKIAGLYVRSLA